MKFQWTKGSTPPIYDDALHIRRQVFMEEQQIDESTEIDDLDDQCFHWVGYLDDRPIATARTLPIDQNTLKIQRIAVLKEKRRLGIGRQLMQAIDDWAINNDYDQLILSAQDPAIPFYQSIGYLIANPEGYLDAGIPHHDMIKHLPHA